MPIQKEQYIEEFRKEMYLQVNILKNKTNCSVINTLIELKVIQHFSLLFYKPFINSQDDYLNSNFMFMSLLHTYYSEFIKFMNRTLTVLHHFFYIKSSHRLLVLNYHKNTYNYPIHMQLKKQYKAKFIKNLFS